MTSIDTINSTPTRKRKRDSDRAEITENICFTNAAFSSTPKTGRSLPILPNKHKTQCTNNTCMEVKSIAELVQKRTDDNLLKSTQLSAFNPYEVQRKPPKKKKPKAIEVACFENPALNLNVPDKQFNPFEVVRDTEKCEQDKRKCFVNSALNIKSQDSVSTVRNPFEIERDCIEPEPRVKSEQIEHTAVDNSLKSANFKLGIPFTPTVGCRIDFNNVSLSQLTPSKLLLAEKLVFSPVPKNAGPKRSLDSISEESSSVSIGKELDRYQLELENSINEAKLRKNIPNSSNERAEEECVYQLQLKVERRTSLTQKLADISESEEYENQEDIVENVASLDEKDIITENIFEQKSTTEIHVNDIEQNDAEERNTNDSQTKELCEHKDVAFESEEEDEDFEFKAPTRFVRAYRRDIAPNTKITKSTESLKSNDSSKSLTECIVEQKSHGGVKSVIRKSIRKFMSHHKHHQENIDPSKVESEAAGEKDCDAKPNNFASHIFSSIRHSLRRKPGKSATEIIDSTSKIPDADISIIDCTERTLKLKSSASQNEYIRIEELTNERRRLRSSTREVRQQLMKTFFQHKHEEYSFR